MHWPDCQISSTTVTRLFLMLITTQISVVLSKLEAAPKCGQLTEGEVCSVNGAQVCRNKTCVSACQWRGMRECNCDLEEDNYCYLCCGNVQTECRPAHQHSIRQPNGERWERQSCARCRTNGYDLDGLPCDDKDLGRLCLQGKCTKSICNDKLQGSFCDKKKEKICVDNECVNPCSKFGEHLMVCDCPQIDVDTGFVSEDRCQLCCYDFKASIRANRRCINAHREWKIETKERRPIWREGLSCAGGKTCNRYGICAASAIYPLPVLLSAILLTFVFLMRQLS